MSAARILVVEDETIVAKDIQSSLQSLDYDVAGLAVSGEKAVEQALKLHPDLVLMDVMLKGDMDGIEAARLIAAARIPVVFLTAYADDDTLRRAKVSDAFGYLLKPFEDRELHSTIEMALYKHNMERQLRESRERLETTLRCIGDAVIAADSSAGIEFINRQAENLTGWKQEEAIGRHISEIFCMRNSGGGSDGACMNIDSILAGKDDAQGGQGNILVARDGRRISIDYSAAPIRESDGAIIGVVIVFRDITNLIQAAAREYELHEKLAHAKNMEALGALAGGVAHDLNNILGPIAAYPDLIMKNLPADSSIRADLEIIKNSAHKAVDVIRDLLTLGRAGNTPMKPIDFNRLVESGLKTSRSPANLENAPLVELVTQLAPDSGMITGSEQQLREMVVNLALNAYATMPKGGRLQIATYKKMLSAPDEGYETVPAGSYIVLHVMDTGMGFGEDDLNRIFEPFYIKKKFNLQSVTGLGLAVVYGVVKAHNGFLNIQSRPGEGSDFTIYLPLAGAAQTTAAPAPENLDFRGSETVLIVDDDEEQRRFAVRWLRSLGYRVLAAHNGSAAIDLHLAEIEAERKIDLLVMDLVMADELDGLDTYRRILERKPGQRAIMVSGFAVTERIKEAFKLGAGQYLQKPYTLNELGRVVRIELDRNE